MNGYKHIDKVGIEIEGLWRTLRTDLVPDLSLHEGVDFPEPYVRHPETGHKIPLFGELVSEPMNDIGEVMSFIEKNWPTETSSKCGFHCHVSLNSLGLYCHTMNRKFYDEFLTSVSKWGEQNCLNDKLFWDRLNDKNRYCRKRFIPDQQVECNSKNMARERQVRATHFNYCFLQHKTLECRLFPMFKDFKTGQSAIMFLVNFIEQYLDKIPEPDKELVRAEEIFGEMGEDSNENVVLEESENLCLDKNAHLYVPTKRKLKKASDKLPPFNLFKFKKENRSNTKPMGRSLFPQAKVTHGFHQPKPRKQNQDRISMRFATLESPISYLRSNNITNITVDGISVGTVGIPPCENVLQPLPQLAPNTIQPFVQPLGTVQGAVKISASTESLDNGNNLPQDTTNV